MSHAKSEAYQEGMRNSFSGGESEHNTLLPLVHNHTRPRKHPHFTGNHEGACPVRNKALGVSGSKS